MAARSSALKPSVWVVVVFAGISVPPSRCGGVLPSLSSQG
jgi:hypothetical protein